MRCPTLADLPAPPPVKTGWPWTQVGPIIAKTMPDGQSWPKITIVTPSYNQGAFIEETIRSVLLQGYPNLEYLVIDGGSKDNSIDIIKKYEPWLTYWVSEPDRGQSHAINKGYALATGDLLGYENSDDLLAPNALYYLALAHVKNKQSIIVGEVINFDESGDLELYHQQNINLQNFVEFWAQRHRWHMPGIFYPRSLIEEVGSMDQGLRYTFDMDLMCRMLRITDVVYLRRPMARFRYHPVSKTVAEFDGFLTETIAVSKRYKDLVGQVNNAGLRTYIAETEALASIKLFRRGQIKPGFIRLGQSLSLTPLGFMHYVQHAVVRRIRMFTYKLGSNKKLG